MGKANGSITLRFLKTIFVTVLLAIGCLGSLMFLYGGASWQTAARMEASHLADVETSELIGTSQYQDSNHPARHNLWMAVGQTFSIPFVRPVSMIEQELPTGSVPSDSSGNGQSNLLSTITSFAQHSKKITLGWIPRNTPNATIRMIAANQGVNVISPGWLTVTDKGSLQDDSQGAVTTYAHEHGVKVWAMLDNQFRANLTHNVLSNASKRDRLISQIVAASKRDHLDGINIDFENLHGSDEQYFTQFVNGLHRQLAPLHVTVSVDITTDIVFLQDDAAYFHAGLAAAADYVILMAYDEHWSGDPTPGPVADVPWVVNGVYDLLDTGVPADKLILGLPLYARFWHIHNDGSVTSEAIADPNIGAILTKNHASTMWNNRLGVAYAKYPKSDGYEEAWYETTKTLNRKLALVQGANLAGVAVWSLNLSGSETWTNVMQALRQSLS